jgi:hypothetical protein
MIARFKSASVFPIESADQFFTDLAGKLDSLERFNRPHPLSTVIAVASLKKFIVEDRFRIELDELINREAEAQLDGFLDFYRSGSPFLNENFKARLEHYEASTEMLRALVATGCYYGRAEHASIWGRLISRMLEIAAQPIGLNPIAKLRKYPASMLFYAGGVACVASGNLRTLKLLLKDLRTNVDRWVDGKEDFVSRKLAVGFVLDSGSLKQALNDPNNFLPSQHMHDLVRESLRSILPSESQFDASFHRFEYLLSLSYLDEQMRDGARLWPALGLFAQELYSYRSNEPSVIEIISKEEDHEGDLWAPVAAGIFAGRQRFLEVQKVYKETVLPVIANWRAGF